uniref:Sortilin-like n=1 Tax=Erpetoichthys calabaricus TaxID=27687 RepID=A0A8C4X6D0_ERPCA
MTSRLLLATLSVLGTLAAVDAIFGQREATDARFRIFRRTRAKREASQGNNTAAARGASLCVRTVEASVLESLQRNTHLHEFTGDYGSSIILSWVGDGTGIILALTTYSPSLSWLYLMSSKLYRSEDSGKTFKDITDVIGNANLEQQFGINVGPGNSKRVILTSFMQVDQRHVGKLFMSSDSGIHFDAVELAFLPAQQIVYHSSLDYLLVTCSNDSLWLSLNFGKQWTKIHDNVQTFAWGPGITIFFSTHPGGVKIDRKGALFLKRTEDLGKTFTIISNNMYSFGFTGRFLFTSNVEKLGEPRVIYVSSDQGDNFNQAQLPSATEEQFYSVLQADEEMIFMHVDDEGDSDFGTIYTSDDRGLLYSKSLERHMFGRNGKNDFTNVTSLRGVYLTNVVDEDEKIKTVITYDRGGEWSPLKTPVGAECAANEEKCNLHIHGEYSKYTDLVPMLPLSDPSAVGLIIAHGSVGSSITSIGPDIYVSDDGGYTWLKTLEGLHHYALLDSGGIIVAVEQRRELPVKTMKFSTDEGQCWNLYNFTDEPIYFAGLASEPGTKTMNVSIWGYREVEYNSYTWVSITVDFEELISRDCQEGDYVKWLAHSTDDDEETSAENGCILGYKETYQRLKKNSVCRNGRDYIVAKEQSSCQCTKFDYLCDYGYFRQENTSDCIEDPSFKNKELEFCLEGNEEQLKTSGYRRVPGDRCEGGFSPLRSEQRLSSKCEKTQKSVSKCSKLQNQRKCNILELKLTYPFFPFAERYDSCDCCKCCDFGISVSWRNYPNSEKICMWWKVVNISLFCTTTTR